MPKFIEYCTGCGRLGELPPPEERTYLSCCPERKTFPIPVEAADKIERLTAENRWLTDTRLQVCEHLFISGSPEGVSKVYCPSCRHEYWVPSKAFASSRQWCCQYHKDGGDTEAACCDTEPREMFAP